MTSNRRTAAALIAGCGSRLAPSGVSSAAAFAVPLATSRHGSPRRTGPVQTAEMAKTVLSAKKRKKSSSKDDMDSFYNWYDSVDDDASPENVFWEEMERQRLLSQIGNDGDGGAGETGAVLPSAAAAGVGAAGATGGQSPPSYEPPMPPMTVEEERGAEATLSNYAQFMVDNNWLNEELALQNLSLDGEGEGGEDGEPQTYDEPWDTFEQEDEDEEDESSGDLVMKFDVEKLKQIPELKDYIMDWDDADEEEMAENEEARRERLSWVCIKSDRLDKARDNPNAKRYFLRSPDELEGFDRMWVAAVDAPCLANLVGVFRNYGIQFADNFADWEDQSPEDAHWSIEDIASFKARQVYEVTGLPCIASRTSFEIEPARKIEASSSANAPVARVPAANPRVQSGYKFNNVGDHVDFVVEALKPQTDPSRVTRFTSCLCYYDGEMEIFDYGYCDCDIYFSNSMRTYIPMSHAITEMCKTLQLTFGLEYQKWLKQKIKEAVGGRGGASIKLRDRVLKEAKVLPNDIIDVSAFIDSNVDVDLMDDCAKELAERFTQMQVKPTKILTVATTGLVIAIPMAKYLQVPVVYARKERNVVMSSTYSASFSSKTVGKNRELLVSTNHISEEDRILIVDDFLSSGASQDALLRIVDEAGATAVGIGVLLEKVYDSGRQSLSGYNVPVESLVRVKSVSEGVIRLMEEVGAT